MLAPNRDYVDLSKPSIEGLVYALRHREVWPKGFVFDWGHINQCAMGLAKQLWPREVRSHNSSAVGKALGISESLSKEIFVSLPSKKDSETVTPRYMATRIEKMTANVRVTAR